jgi:hypothetical protein
MLLASRLLWRRRTGIPVSGGLELFSLGLDYGLLTPVCGTVARAIAARNAGLAFTKGGLTGRGRPSYFRPTNQGETENNAHLLKTVCHRHCFRPGPAGAISHGARIH